MKKEFVEYLEAIGLVEDIRKRVESIYEFYEQVCPDEITDIFVSEYVKEDGSREYESLSFFSERYCMEAKQFITKDEFDNTPMKNRIYYWELKKQDYDFEKATERSRFHLFFRLDTDVMGEFKAAKENCDYLKDIFLKYVVPNLKK